MERIWCAKIIDQKYYCSNYYDINLINMVLNVGHH